jgi:hypothetical protein
VGFSLLGLAVALAVLLPSLLLVWFPPTEPWPDVAVPRILTALERVGQALCVVVPAVVLPGTLVWPWLIVAIAALAGYDALWGRYLDRGRSLRLLYGPFWRVPVPMAILPVVTFLAAAAWLSNPWLAVAAVVLAIGHIPASVIIARTLATDSGARH